jgi:hypothetical protein
MGNNAMSFAVIVVGGGNSLIQAAQGQWRSITTRGCGAQRAGLIKQRQRAPPDGQGGDSDSIAIAENNMHWRWGDWEDDRIGLRCNAMTTTTTTTTKKADNHDKEDPSEGEKYAWRAKARRRDQRLPRRYVVRPSMLTTATWLSWSLRRQQTQPRLHHRCRWEWGRQ